MHQLFARILSQRDLSRAGDLFSIPDCDIVDDLSEALNHIQMISSLPDYLENHNDQAVVEICITRVTTAIRDTGTIEQHAEALVSLWSSCLQHNLKPLARDEDPPHAKIASDIMSCLFMQNYSKYSVMKTVLPVAVQFLKHENREISRNMSSYLALAAIDNASLLALHCDDIIDSIIRGNRSLARILPQVYLEKPAPIDANVDELLHILPRCDDTEKAHLLQLVSLVAKQNPKLLLAHVPLLVKCLTIPNSSQTVLAALVDVASVDARPFASCLTDLEGAISRQPSLLSMALKIFGAVGRLNQVSGKECMAFLVEQLGAIDQTSLPAVLIEIKSIADQHSGLLGTHIAEISLQGESPSMAARMIIQQLQQDMTYSEHDALREDATQEEPKRMKELSSTPPTPSKSMSMSEMHRMGMEPERRMHYRKGKASNRGSVDHLLSSVQKLTASTSSAALMPSEKPGSLKDLDSMKQIKLRSQSHSETVPLTESRTSLQMAGSTLTKTKGKSPAPSSSSQKSDVQRRISNKEGAASAGSKGNLYQEETSRPSSIVNGGTNSRLVGSSQNGSSSGMHVQEGGQLGREANGSDPVGVRTSLVEGSKPVPLEGIKVGLEASRGPTSLEGVKASSSLKSAGGNRDSSLQMYLSKRQKEIISYMDSIKKRIPVPDECSVRENSGRNPVGRLDFYCQRKGQHCLYSTSPFAVETKEIQPWIHLKFLQLQATSPSPVSLDDRAVQSLRKNWERQKTVGGTMTFLKLITQNFPPSKVQQALTAVLNKGSFYDLFTYNPQQSVWNCFICNNPSKFDLATGGRPLIEGQLKEKKVRFKLFRRWRTRYFTLAGEQLYTKSNSQSKPALPIELSKVQGVKTVHGGRRHERSIPKAFEIFTEDKTYIFKTKDGKGAEQWVQCLTLAVRKASRKGGGANGAGGGGETSGDVVPANTDSTR
ncbi:ventricular zone-expressed PH domain-containing protein homolog 1-like [Patiria miniata]|uniref:PH domain-containing protein n=1 Tax=Patiria miniata TaxID=46514 RepID=A0A914AD46_PATMI|nr:ventricular zone-expressed PH domain-containing protein homolog 1-like [Patiria miniata]XP_038061668.1 ventricular zone-expressed PH domain-containing protein homolog 1-like [Patiria miniata]